MEKIDIDDILTRVRLNSAMQGIATHVVAHFNKVKLSLLPLQT